VPIANSIITKGLQSGSSWHWHFEHRTYCLLLSLRASWAAVLGADLTTGIAVIIGLAAALAVPTIAAADKTTAAKRPGEAASSIAGNLAVPATNLTSANCRDLPFRTAFPIVRALFSRIAAHAIAIPLFRAAWSTRSDIDGGYLPLGTAGVNPGRGAEDAFMRAADGIATLIAKDMRTVIRRGAA
jgi:hypothetical protein